ncbi:hypothetical protein SAMN05421736_11870 [Evansella caseinilytica]|uniref:Uncharacterized protein n=1 Tax=Evansella caseinilytica TaxID=1503961 RepID=A0A1H3U6H6_9BACI|nr:hypothetical protein [Evansella caseinilytica]SDZ57425.1 hypothetical protein SAMN05421736_11870 [Evansella caseinilytica]
MSNIIWYYGLIAIGVIVAGYTMYRKRNVVDLFTYFLFTTAWTWVGEAVVLFVFNAYAYKPGLYSDPFKENIIGHIIANSSYWAATAIFVMSFQVSYLWIGLISILYMLTEVLFLKVGVYSQHWWPTYVTGIIAFVFMAAMRKWYVILHQTRRKFPRNFVFWTIAWIILQTPTSVLMLFDKLFFRVHWVENLYRDSTLFSGFLYHVIAAFIVIFFIYVPKNNFWKIAPLIILVISDAILLETGILLFSSDWKFVYLICIRAASLLFIYALERFTLIQLRVEKPT